MLEKNMLHQIKEARSLKSSSMDEESLNGKEGPKTTKNKRKKLTKNVTGIQVARQDTREDQSNEIVQKNDAQQSDEDSEGSSGSVGTSLTSDLITPSVVEQIADEKVSALRDEIIQVQA